MSKWLQLVVVVGMVLVPTACGGGSNGASSSNDGAKDVTVMACSLRAGVAHTAVVEIENSSSDASDYRIRVVFESPDHETTYGESPEVVIDGVDPGKTKRARFVLKREGEDPSKEMVCQPEVTRSPST